jgi:hypothetical protein
LLRLAALQDARELATAIDLLAAKDSGGDPERYESLAHAQLQSILIKRGLVQTSSQLQPQEFILQVRAGGGGGIVSRGVS